jgi:hypothetical protein
MVSILVLLCQGLLFENEESGDQVVFAFGVLIILIVCFCICLTMYSMMNSLLRPQNKSILLLQRQSARKLPRDMLLELYFLNSLSKIDFQREIEVDMEEFKSVMTKAEFEATRSIVDFVYKPLDMVRSASVHSETGEHSEKDENLLHSVLPTKPGGAISPNIFEPQAQMLNEFSQTVSHQQ